MEDVLKEIVAAQDLRIGMFVSELDRPWLESPFLLQGFIIEDKETLAQLRALCRFVHVDRARSAGDAWRPEPVEPPSAMMRREPVPLAGLVTTAPARRRPLDFFALLKSLRSAAGEVGESAAAGAEEAPGRAPWVHIYPGSEPARPVARGVSGNAGAAAAHVSRPFIYEDEPGRASAAGASRDERPDDEAGAFGSLRQAEPRVSVEEEIVTVLPVLVKAQGLLAEVARDVQNNLNPDLDRLRSVVSEMVLSVIRNPDALLWLLRLKQTDQYSYDHSLDVAAHVMIFGRALGLGEESVMALGMAGILQDVGKLRLPVRLLHKTGALSPREYEIFKTHVDFSLHIVSRCPQATPLMLEIIGRHHERCDGSGYPARLKGDELGVMAEIAGICDVYCAMTRARPYGSAASAQVALDAIRAQRGTRFSNSMVDQFVQCIGLYPVGTLVELNTGEVGVVIAQNRIRRLKPRVMILLGPDKKPNAYPPSLDLLYDPATATGEPYAISRALPPGSYGVEPSEFYLA
ncbi:HD-GYP domain-containing protein [Zoogloea sp.]|uniref:HD-GYP domain-containing protein n=1 Tax=Zoogloea sp. TaxID=49181 RepID=UPI001416D042|nr:MAG: HD-GYP domain-containing protein [Zoogloea sp.]